MRDRISGIIFLLASILASILILNFVIDLASTAKRMNDETTVRREYQEDLNYVANGKQYLDTSRVLTTDEVVEFIRDNGIKYDYFIAINPETEGGAVTYIDITPNSKRFKDAYEASVKNAGETVTDIAGMATYLQNNIYTSNYLRNELLYDYLGLTFKPYIYVNRSSKDNNDYQTSLNLSDTDAQNQTNDMINRIKTSKWSASKPMTSAYLTSRNYTLLDAISSGEPFVIVFQQWEADAYSIYWFDLPNPNFKYAGNKEELPTKYKSSSPTYYPPNASTVSRLGYTFNGWSPTSIPSNSSGDVEFKGKWTPNKYNIHFNTNGGNLASGVDVVADYSDGYDNKGYNLPTSNEEINKSGYLFVGWYLDSALTKPAGDTLVGGYYDDEGHWHGGNVKPNSDGSINDITLYAKWEAAPSQYKVVCKSSTSGKTIGSGSAVGAHYGDTITLTYPSGGIPNINGYTPTVTTKSVTISATGGTIQEVVVTYNPITYHITYDMGIAGGTTTGGPSTYTVEDTINFTSTNPKPTGYNSAGYEFLGWEPSTISGQTGDLVVKAQWKAITKPYTIYCKSSKTDKLVATFEYKKDFSTLGSATTFSVKAPTSDTDSTYTTGGLSNPQSGSLLGYKLADATSKTVSINDSTVTFKYDPIVYDLVYVANDNPTIKFFAGNSSVKQKYTVEDAEEVISAIPTRVGYKFKEWIPKKYSKGMVKDATADNKIIIKAVFEFLKYPIDYVTNISDTNIKPKVNGGAKWDYYTIDPSDNYYANFKLDPLTGGFNQDGYYYSFDKWAMQYKRAEVSSGTIYLGILPLDKVQDKQALDGLFTSTGVDYVDNKYYANRDKTKEGKSVTRIKKTETYVEEIKTVQVDGKSVRQKYYSIVNPTIALAQGLTTTTGDVWYYTCYIGTGSNKVESKDTNVILYEDIGKGLGTTDPPVMTFSAHWTKMYWIWDYEYTGGVQSFKAPATGYYMFECWGANGGGNWEMITRNNSAGGVGGYSRGLIQLNAGKTVYIYVGGKGSYSSGIGSGGGYNGGGQGGPAGYGGGGMTHISTTQNLSKASVTGSNASDTYTYTGSVQVYTAPITGTYTIDAYGAQGGSDVNAGGRGGRVTGKIDLTAGTKLYLYVGGQGASNASGNGGGWPGGGDAGPSGSSGGGGGATVITRSATYGNSVAGSDSQTWGARTDATTGHYYLVDYWGNNISGDTKKASYYDTSNTFHESNSNEGAYKIDVRIHSSNYFTALYQANTTGRPLEFKTFGSPSSAYTKFTILDINDAILVAGGGGGAGSSANNAGAGGSGGNGSYQALGNSHYGDGGGGGGGYYGGAAGSGDQGGSGGSSYTSGMSSVTSTAGVQEGNGKIIISYSTFKDNSSWSESGTLLIAGGGGGADNASSNYNTSTGDDGAGGYGGGKTAGNARVDGTERAGTGATQSTGNTRGIGQSVSTATDTGGGGAGFYGGKVTNHNNGGGGGGSGYYYGSSSYELLSGAQASGYQYNGRDTSGNYTSSNNNGGNGRARITWKGDAGSKATATQGAWSAGILKAYDEMLTKSIVYPSGKVFCLDKAGTYKDYSTSTTKNVVIPSTGAKRVVVSYNYYNSGETLLTTAEFWNGATYR